MANKRPGLAQLHITVDIVIFTISEGVLHVLLLRRDSPPHQGELAIPGGYIWENETSEQAVKRIMDDKVGVSNVFVEQLYTFDGIERDPRGRIISVAYFALVPESKIKQLATGVSLHQVFELPKLAFDHNKILDMAKQRTRSKLEYTNAAYSLLPSKFTLSELQDVYEACLNQQLDKRNFRKKILSLDIIKATNEMRTGGKHRPARLYSFKKTQKQSLDTPFLWTQ